MNARDFTPITATNPYLTDDDFTSHYDQDDADAIRDLLIGKTVRKAADDHLVLSDGTVLKLVGNEGGCACSAGDYDLTELNSVDNIITNVEFDDDPGSDDKPCATCGERWCYEDGHDNDSEGHYRIFVFADAQKINLATFEGSDGSGWYGTGYHIFVRAPQAGDDK